MVCTSVLPSCDEFVNRVHVIVHHPDVLFWIVGIDGHEVRTLENFVPLRPSLHDFSLRVDDREAVLPLRVMPISSYGAIPFPELGTIVGILPRSARRPASAETVASRHGSRPIGN